MSACFAGRAHRRRHALRGVLTSGLKIGSDWVLVSTNTQPLHFTMTESTPQKQSETTTTTTRLSDVFEGNCESVYTSFDDMDLQPELLHGIYSHGFEEPSPIQQRAIVPISKGRNVIAQAQSGTGKTGTFVIGALNHVDPALRATQVLIISPTHELARQTYDVAEAIGARMGVKCVQCVGKTSRAEDSAAVRQGPHLVTGSPGRVLDLMERGDLDVRDLRTFVMDEADEMLSRGFSEQIERIVSLLPRDTQMVVVSATFPREALDMTRNFVDDPVRILVPERALDLTGIHQNYVSLGAEHKLLALLDIVESIPINKMIIFVNTRGAADRLSAELNERLFTVSSVHADLPPAERRAVTDRFRKGDSRVLVATDVLARGFDVQQVSLVINYELPRKPESYVHRIGRCGRRGRKGVVINFVAPRDESDMANIVDRYGYHIDELPSDFARLFK
eukprot:m.185591 g.185591  ORF g.185591 m.185591 type:complete len:449 (-) comp15400_c0_seq4:35-1381(-)